MAEFSDEAVERVAAVVIAEYHADYLTDCLHGGVQAEPWEPHVGQRAQAKANAERYLAALTRDDLVDALLRCDSVEEAPGKGFGSPFLLRDMERGSGWVYGPLREQVRVRVLVVREVDQCLVCGQPVGPEHWRLCERVVREEVDQP